MNYDLEKIIKSQPAITDFLNNIHDAIYIVDTNERYIYLNKAAEEADGYTMGELVGLTIKEIYNLDPEESPLRIVCRTGKKVENFAYRYPVNGKVVYHVCNAYPIIIDNELYGAYAIQSNFTNIKDMFEENLRLQKKIFESHENDANYYAARNNCFDKLIGVDSSFIKCIDIANQAAKGDSSVFLTGRTGTGKELFAKCIHEAGGRRDKPFLAINCSAIPETLVESILFGTSKGAYTGAVEKKGLFEQAKGGTLFLDELNSMPLSSQAKLLRVLEEKQVTHLGGQEPINVDVRIISSSNAMPADAIEQKHIREDLYYRLSIINIVIPDLADRKNDIPLLTNHFINAYNKKFNKNIIGLDSETRKFFQTYNWPGNVRQLRHCIESAMNFVSDRDMNISREHLPQYIFNDMYPPCDVFDHREYLDENVDFLQSAPEMSDVSEPSKTPAMHSPEDSSFKNDNIGIPDGDNIFDYIQKQEREEIINALLINNGNVTKTAAHLNIGRQALIYRMKKYKIKKKNY